MEKKHLGKEAATQEEKRKRHGRERHWSERVKGIEPSLEAWEATVLPLKPHPRTSPSFPLSLVVTAMGELDKKT